MLPLTGLAFFMAAASLPGEVSVSPRPEVELHLADRVAGRAVRSLPDGHVHRSGDTVVAWTAVSGVPSGFVEHVWYRDNVEVARHYLPVGAGRRWRTWSRHRLEGGEYQLQVLGPDGRVLKELRFSAEDEPPHGC